MVVFWLLVTMGVFGGGYFIWYLAQHCLAVHKSNQTMERRRYIAEDPWFDLNVLWVGVKESPFVGFVWGFIYIIGIGLGELIYVD